MDPGARSRPGDRRRGPLHRLVPAVDERPRRAGGTAGLIGRRRPHAHARRPGRHRLLHDLHDRQPRRPTATTSSTCSTPAPRTTASTRRRSTAATSSTRTSTATSRARLTTNPTDDIFLLRAAKCIDTEGPYGVTDVDFGVAGHGVPTSCVADRDSRPPGLRRPAPRRQLADGGSAATAAGSSATSRATSSSGSTTTRRSTAG